MEKERLSKLAFWTSAATLVALMVFMFFHPFLDGDIGQLLTLLLIVACFSLLVRSKKGASGKKALIASILFSLSAVAFISISDVCIGFWGKIFIISPISAAITMALVGFGATEINVIRKVAVWSAGIALVLLLIIGFIHGQTPSASRLETLAYVAIVCACLLSAISPIRIFADGSFIPVLSILGFIVALIFFLVIKPINLDIWGKLLVIAWMTAAFSRTYAEASDIFGWNLKHRG